VLAAGIVPYFGGMKHLLFVLAALLLACLRSYAQTPLPDTLHYQQVIAVPGVSADELYGRVREWVALTFEDVHQVVQLEDAPRHVVIGSGYSNFQVRRPNGKPGAGDYLWFRFRVETREGRYRIEISNLGSVYQFHDFSNPGYAAYDLARWVHSAQATQALSERHQALSRGFSQISSYPTPEQATAIKAGLQQRVQELFASLRQVVTAPAATW
jgi:hypothetical protein